MDDYDFGLANSDVSHVANDRFSDRRRIGGPLNVSLQHWQCRFHACAAFSDGLLGFRELHRANVLNTRHQHDVGWFASETGPRDVVLHDVDGVIEDVEIARR